MPRLSGQVRAMSVGVMVLAAACISDLTEPLMEEPPPVVQAAVATDPVTGASIETDLDDYQPGQPVLVTLRGWAANEDVRLVLTEEPETHDAKDTTVVVDGDGYWSGPFYDVEEHDLGVTFTLSATGQTSGSTATVTFTDANPQRPTVTVGQSPDPVTAGGSATYTIQVSFVGNSQSCSITLGVSPTASPAWPSEVSFGFSNNPLTGTGTGASSGDVRSSVLTISTPTGMPAATYKFTVTTTRGATGCQGTDQPSAEVNLVVQAAANQPPVLGAIGDKDVDEETLLSFSATATDPDGGTLTFSLADGTDPVPDGAAITAGGGFTWTPTEEQGPGTYSFKVVVTDPDGNTDDEEITVTVNEVNLAPVLAAIGDQTIDELIELTFTASATDPDIPANTLTFSLSDPSDPDFPTGAMIDATTGVFTWTPSEAQGPGMYTVTVIVTDDGDPSLSNSEEIQITVNEVQSDPVLDPIGDQEVDEETLLSFTAMASDQDGGILTFSLDGEPAGAAITANGDFTWTPTEEQGPGMYTFKVVVTDPDGNTDDEEITVTVNEVNLAPELDFIGDQTVDELTELTFTASASDADIPANTLTFSLDNPATGNFPTGATINGTSGVFSWTPSEAQGPKVYRVKVVVTDNGDPALSATEEIEIEVFEVNVAPVLTVPAGFSIPWDDAISGVQASATDDDVPANGLTFSLVSPPAGMTIDPADGTISWTPASGDIGANTITVRVDDDGSPSLGDEASFVITVTQRATKLTYDSSTAGQYSDQSRLAATLVDDATGDPLVALEVSFTLDGVDAGTATTGADGQAAVLYTVPLPAGTYTVAASFAGTIAYESASDDATFTVAAEHASVTPHGDNKNAYKVANPGGSATFTLTFLVREKNGPEPQVNDGALAGDINNTTLAASLSPVGTGATVNGVCTPQGTSNGTYPTRTFTCQFTNVPVHTYELTATVGEGGTPSARYYTGSYWDALTVYDPSLGFVTGGGTFRLDGDRVSFGLSFTFTGRNRSDVRGRIVAIRHHADGSICRIKGNNLDAPAVNGTTATFSGKVNYVCVDQYGVEVPETGKGNLTMLGYVADNGEPGSQDRIWLKAYGELIVPGNPPTGSVVLTGGNIQVPQPQGTQ